MRALITSSGSLEFKFNSNNYVDTGFVYNTTSADYTIECWFRVRPDASNVSGWNLFLGAYTDNNNYLYLGINGTNKFFLRANGHIIASTTNANDDRWHHGLVTRIGGTVYLYLDGKLEATSTQALTSTTNVNLTIGRYNASYPADAKVYGLRLWNVGKTASQVLDCMLNDVLDTTGLLREYKLVRIEGTQVIERNGNHGTLVGTPTQSKDSPFNKALAVNTTSLKLNSASVQFVAIAPVQGSQLSGGFSFEVTAYITASSKSFGGLWELSENNIGSNTINSISLRWSSSNMFFGIYHNGNSDRDYVTLNSRTQYHDRWVRFGVSFSATGLMKYFVDGVRISTWQSPRLPANVTRSLNWLGRCSQVNGNDTMDGMIGDAKLWSRELSEQEMGIGTSPIGIIEHWDIKNSFGASSIKTVNGSVNTLINGASFVQNTNPLTKLLLSQPKTPYALDLSNTNHNGININSILSSNNDTTTSIEMFIKPSQATTSTGNCLLQLSSDSNDISLFYGDLTASNTNEEFSILISGSGQRAWMTINNNTTEYVNKWVHVIFVLSSSYWKIIVNGIDKPLTVHGNSSYNKPAVGTIQSYLGTGTASGTAFKRGAASSRLLGEASYIRFWNRELVVNDIPMLFSSNNFSHSDLANTIYGAYGAINTMSSKLPIPSDIKLIESTAPIGQRSTLELTSASNTLNFVDTNFSETIDVAATPRIYEAWIYNRRNISNNNHRILFGYSNHGSNQRLYVGDNSNNNWGIGIGEHTFNTTGSSNTPVKNNTWQHVLLVINGITAQLIIDNTIVRTISFTGFITSGNLLIGASALTGSFLRVACLRVWATGNVADIAKYKHVYAATNTPLLLEQWGVQEGIGNVLYGTKGTNSLPITTPITWQTPTVANWVNKCARFVGSNYMYTEPSFVTFQQGFCIEFMYRSSGYHQNKLLIGKVGSLGTSFQVLLDSSSTLQVTVYADELSGTSISRSIGIAHADINNGQWHHVAFYIEPTNFGLRVDLDGVRYNSTSSNYIVKRADGRLLISAREVSGVISSSSFTDAVELDEIRLWNIARHQAEVAQNRNRVLDRHPNLVGYWRMDGNGWDASGHGNHLIPVGYGETDPFVVSDNPNLIYNAPINDAVVGSGTTPLSDPPAAPSYLYKEDFEDGLGFNEPIGNEYISMHTSHPWSFTVIDNPTNAAAKVGRFELNRTDTINHSGKRSEASFTDSSKVTEGWYSWKGYFPSDGWVAEDDDTVIAQWHGGSGAGSPIVSLREQKGNFQVRVFDPDGIASTVRYEKPFANDMWHDFIFRIVFHPTNGIVEGWHNGVKFVDWQGYTMKAGFDTPKLKIGIYKSEWNSEPNDSITNQRVWYIDNLKIGTSDNSYNDMIP